MLTHLPSPHGRRSHIQSGFTLMEMMVALMAGLMILGSVVYTSISLSHSMVAISNYYQLDTSSRNTLDVMSRDIRNAGALISYATNSLSMSGTNVSGQRFLFTYRWDGSNMWRSYSLGTFNGGSITYSTTTSLMLSNCAYLAFSNYTRVPQAGFTFNAVNGTTNRTKLISVSWKCSRSILGAKLNTESVQTAKIVIRN
jgi:prepilin-type N-terminal cleavage/methylation domain-containing protein